ncbi:DUF4391 domain-containing protein, partial [Acinetobacter baumannii]|nr:DUF4391 domain-containing protein [Acinetobacter baumannii]
ILPITSSEDSGEDDESISIELKLQRAQQLESLQKQLDKLKSKLRTEKQFNRKVELNKHIHALESDLNKLVN